ncbi:MAG: DUF7347 domain-containing protein [Candidatus Helarchaeota archaeon]
MSSINEEDIFKTLSHRIRREIIKIIGKEGRLTFSEIQNQLDGIDSPTLSYHLKNMLKNTQPLLKQEKNAYLLSDIGEASLLLLTKTDQSIKISRYRKNFLYAYIVTVVCWITAETIIPLILYPNIEHPTFLAYIIVINVLSIVNWIILWTLKKKYT